MLLLTHSVSIEPALTPTRRNEMSGSSVFLTNLKFKGSNCSITSLLYTRFIHIWNIHGTLWGTPLTIKELSGKSTSNTRWKLRGNFLIRLSFLKLFGNIKDTLSANSQDFLINFMASDDWRPNGGLPTICILFRNSLSPVAYMSRVKKSYFYWDCHGCCFNCLWCFACWNDWRGVSVKFESKH